MGRSRVHNTTDNDPHHRSKRRKVTSSAENLDSASAGITRNDEKGALYHCNYCNKDLSGKIRIKCANCPDFDLCVECFSVGAEVTPHRSNHQYRVMDNLSFPLTCRDWNADEEILLLEGIEMYGLGNWAEVAEHVGTKNKTQCIDHYTTAFMNSPCYPLPDMSHVVGKNRKDLLAMAKIYGDGKKAFSMQDEANIKEESPFSLSRIKVEDLSKDLPSGRSPSTFITDGDSREFKASGNFYNSTAMSSGAVKKASNNSCLKDGQDGVKIEDSQVDRSVREKKPKCLVDEGPSINESSGYNPKRQEFDPEYDNDAEQSLAEMEFKETDSDLERQLKLRVLHIYLSRLDERKRRKDFILERKLIYPDHFEKDLSDEDRDIYQRFKVFMRFHSQEEHESLVRGVIQECQLRRKIQELQECRAAGLHTQAEVDIYIAQKRKIESENKAKEDGQIVVSGKVLGGSRPLDKEKSDFDVSPRSIINNYKIKGPTTIESGGKDLSSTTIQKLLDWDITGLPGAELLSEAEHQLCCQTRLIPSLYLKMQEILMVEMFKGTITQKSDAYRFFKVDPSKVDKVYDIFMKKGW